MRYVRVCESPLLARAQEVTPLGGWRVRGKGWYNGDSMRPTLSGISWDLNESKSPSESKYPNFKCGEGEGLLPQLVTFEYIFLCTRVLYHTNLSK